jgi:DNA-binding transcriptional MerR regulator
MASNGPEAFRTISEVAEDLDLPQHVLRFWETRFTQIKPMKRGGGRRYYRPDDVDLLRGIRHLLYGEGYTIRGVQRILKEQGPRSVIGAVRNGFRPEPEDDVADEEPEEEIAAPALADFDDDASAEHDRAAPAFDPREFHSSRSARVNGAVAAGLSKDDVRRLQATLMELLELKRILDQSRG